MKLSGLKFYQRKPAYFVARAFIQIVCCARPRIHNLFVMDARRNKFSSEENSNIAFIYDTIR